MPLTITRPTLDLPQVQIQSVPQMVEEMATLASDALKSYTPNRGKIGRLQPAVSNKQPIANGWGVGGPIGKNGLLPDPSAAPKGMILEFLLNHPEYMKRNKGRGRRRAFPMAWHYLPREAKDLLREERNSGMYQSGAPAAPYWLIAEEGMERVGVPARLYLRNSHSTITRAVPLVRKKYEGKL